MYDALGGLKGSSHSLETDHLRSSMDLNSMQEKRRRWSQQYQAEEQWSQSTRDAASEGLTTEEAVADAPSFGTSSAVDALLQGDAYPPQAASYQSDAYTLPPRSHERDAYAPQQSSYQSDPYPPQASSYPPPPSGYSAPGASGYSRPSSSRAVDVAPDLFDVREDDGDEDDGFEQQMAAVEAQHSAPTAPAARAPAYFRSRKEAAAVLLRHSHFSSGSKLFSGGAIAVRVSRISVRDAARDAEAVAQGVRLEVSLFGKPVRSFDVDLCGREAREGMHGGAEAVLDAALCHEEDAAVLSQLLMRAPLCEFRLLSPGAQPRLLASAAIDLAAMSHDIATITLPLTRPGDAAASQLLGEITCSITAGMPRAHPGVLAQERYARSHSRTRSLPRSDGTMSTGAISPHTGSRHRLHGSHPAAATTRPLSAGPMAHNRGAIGAPVLGPSLASLADKLDARGGRAPGGRARPQSAAGVRGVPASALSAAAGYAPKGGRPKPEVTASVTIMAGQDLRRAADEAEELAIVVHAAPSYPASAPPTLSHGEAEPYWNAWRLSQLPKGQPEPGKFILLAEVRHARTVDVRQAAKKMEEQARLQKEKRGRADDGQAKKEPAALTHHMSQMTTKHNGAKYAEYLKKVKEVVEESDLQCETIVVPAAVDDSPDSHVWRARHDSADKFHPRWKTPRMARLGAFELQLVWCEQGQVVSELLHTKLGSLHWPSMARLATSLQRVNSYVNEPQPSSYQSDPYAPQPSSYQSDPYPPQASSYQSDPYAPQDQRIHSDAQGVLRSIAAPQGERSTYAPPAREEYRPPAHARVESAPARAEYVPPARPQPPARPVYQSAGGGDNYDNYGDDSDIGDQGFSGDEGDY